MSSIFVPLQVIPCAKDHSTMVARNCNSFEMVELHVISYVVSDSLLATELAEVGGCHLGGAVHLLSISDHPLAALHQGLHLGMGDPSISFCDGSFTFSSSSNKSPLNWLWMASTLDLFSPRVTSSTEATLSSLGNVA